MGRTESDRAVRCSRLTALTLILVVTALQGCGGGSDSFAIHTAACTPRAVVNEFVRETVFDADGARQRVTVELHNPTDCVVDGGTLKVRYGDAIARTDAAPLLAKAYRTVQLVVTGPVTACTECGHLELSRDADGVLLDRVPVPAATTEWQSAGRVSGGTGPLALQEPSEITLGAPNLDQGPVVRLTGKTGFPARDSSPNAIVHHKGAYWVLGGWGNHGHDLWYSVADVWWSEDGVNWRLVNAQPPYSPYSAFVVFQGRIWALGDVSFSSDDGKACRRETLSFPLTKRATVFRDAIYGLVDSRVLRSTDGVRWTTLVENVPWGPNRKEPQLLVHGGLIWMIGGTDEPPGGSLTYRNDVWNSFDGVHWRRVTAAAEWEPRRWFGAISHAGKLWVVNGANFDAWPNTCNNIADIWISDDGAHWRKARVDRLWGARHASFLLPARDGGVLLAAGYGNCGIDRMYADVWRVEYRSSMDAQMP
jgi:hypothetical protein